MAASQDKDTLSGDVAFGICRPPPEEPTGVRVARRVFLLALDACEEEEFGIASLHRASNEARTGLVLSRGQSRPQHGKWVWTGEAGAARSASLEALAQLRQMCSCAKGLSCCGFGLRRLLTSTTECKGSLGMACTGVLTAT